jgi:hypothetical protein
MQVSRKQFKLENKNDFLTENNHLEYLTLYFKEIFDTTHFGITTCICICKVYLTNITKKQKNSFFNNVLAEAETS